MRLNWPLIMLVLLLPSFSLKAQWKTGGDIDANWIHFGILVGYDANTFQVDKVRDFQTQGIIGAHGEGNISTGRLQVIEAKNVSGFHLGLLANLRLTDNLDLRFVPDANFADRKLVFDYAAVANSLNASDPTQKPQVHTNQIEKTISSTYIELPLLLKFKSDRKKNVRAYVIGGLQYSFNIVPEKKTDDRDFAEADKLVKVKKDLFSYKVGLGVDIYNQYFKMSPEITISNALSNSVVNDGSVFSKPISRLFPSSIQLTLYFE